MKVASHKDYVLFDFIYMKMFRHLTSVVTEIKWFIKTGIGERNVGKSLSCICSAGDLRGEGQLSIDRT